MNPIGKSNLKWDNSPQKNWRENTLPKIKMSMTRDPSPSNF